MSLPLPLEAGSSPLTRGKRRGESAPAAGGGLIPAHAGKTSARPPTATGGTAHPRSRGENGTRSDLAYVTEGSSPLTRGKREAETGERVLGGLIPAHAGKTSRPCPPAPGGWAHPRSRGENRSRRERKPATTGSSPLTRGKRVAVGGRCNVGGLIPAHAGKTDTGGVSTYGHGAHPRSRGENHGVQSRIVNQTGSSPLTRGKPQSEQPISGTSGLIPAHAGKTGGCRPRVPRRAAHPRSRGENLRSRLRPTWCSGSSPLTRGKPWRTGRRRLPTRAHPRSRGENRLVHGIFFL